MNRLPQPFDPLLAIRFVSDPDDDPPTTAGASRLDDQDRRIQELEREARILTRLCADAYRIEELRMYHGTICRIVLGKGFGFIATANQPDTFFHCKDLPDDLPFDESLQERRISFDIITGAKDARATNIQAAS